MSWSRRQRNLKRLARIGKVAAKHGFGYFIERYGLKQYLSKGEKKKRFKVTSEDVLGRRLKAMLQDLGPTFVKIGQLVSIRPDLAPPRYYLNWRNFKIQLNPLNLR